MTHTSGLFQPVAKSGEVTAGARWPRYQPPAGVMLRNIWPDADILDAMVGAVGQHANLTEVLLEALRNLAAGRTHTAIGDQRGVSLATIKKLFERAREVLGAPNEVHALAIASRRGLIFTEPTF